MELTSTVDIDAPADRIYPLFLDATMDERIPLPFRFGLPKAVSCSIIDGDGGVGSIRRCITTRGFMDQVIEGAEPGQRFAYRLIDSDYWGQPFIGHVADEITLSPLPGGRTRVRRVTSFDARGILRWPARIIMRQGFRHAHSYANENWRRIATA
ncbi:SRPBCC family protein [Paracoccus aurantiacus]|nr:SRPBCC family protein [Paracoccus aurantiacus]